MYTMWELVIAISNIPNIAFLDQFLEKMFISIEQLRSIFSPSNASVAPINLLYIMAIMGASMALRTNSPAVHKGRKKQDVC